MVFTGLYFRTEITSYVTQYVGRQDVASAINGQVESRQAVQAKELAEARRTVDELKQSLGQKSDSTTALTQEVNAVQEALKTSEAQHRQALEEQRARSNALAGELTAARHDRDTRVVLSSKAADEATQLRKAAEARAATSQASAPPTNVLRHGPFSMSPSQPLVWAGLAVVKDRWRRQSSRPSWPCWVTGAPGSSGTGVKPSSSSGANVRAT